jgi:hypothetical protein
MRQKVASQIVVTLLNLITVCNPADDKADPDQVSEEFGFDTPHAVSQTPSTRPLSPDESLKSFRLPKAKTPRR